MRKFEPVAGRGSERGAGCGVLPCPSSSPWTNPVYVLACLASGSTSRHGRSGGGRGGFPGRRDTARPSEALPGGLGVVVGEEMFRWTAVCFVISSTRLSDDHVGFRRSQH